LLKKKTNQTNSIVESFLYKGDELLLPYVRECMSSSTYPTASGFFEWTAAAIDPNYRYLLIS